MKRLWLIIGAVSAALLSLSLASCVIDVSLGNWPMSCAEADCGAPCSIDGSTGQCDDSGLCILDDPTCTTNPCANLDCGSPCDDASGGYCDAYGQCQAELTICPDAACLGKLCGSPCAGTDDFWYCNEYGQCSNIPPLCSCTGRPCGAPCCVDEVCSDFGPSYVCQLDGSCQAGVPACSQQSCGPNFELCPTGSYCCNDSCGTCVPHGADCVQTFCDVGQTPCGFNFCEAGEYCCDPTCGICANETDGSCPSTGCDDPSTVCGENVCWTTDLCCNPSCGICTSSSNTCSAEQCPVEAPCGNTSCKSDEYCCNESCSICVPLSGSCPLTPCT